jgi:predicted esterase
MCLYYIKIPNFQKISKSLFSIFVKLLTVVFSQTAVTGHCKTTHQKRNQMIKILYLLILGLLIMICSSAFGKSFDEKSDSTISLVKNIDTITFNRTDNRNEFIFGKTNWKWPFSYPRQGEAINPNYDTIFLRQDSSLFNGYLKMLAEEIHSQNDTVKFGVALYKVTKGIPHLIHSYSYACRYPATNRKFRWKAYETIVTDSNKISLSYYPNGFIKTEEEFRFRYKDTLIYFNSFDSTGILQMRNVNKGVLIDGQFTFSLNSTKLYDQSRQREIPIAIYKPTSKVSGKQKIVIFSHGYGQNKGGDYLAYSYLTEFLASNGYFVVSIQHELATDSLLPMTGNPQIARRPFWERGADNILFVIKELRKINPDLDYKHITIIGHSNGGDMTALFPQKYPNLVEKIITLDNRRMLLPKTKKVKVYSLRSSDQPADEGVIPTEKEIKKYKMKIVKLANTTHNEMDDNANGEQRKEIQEYILTFIND